MDDDYDSGIFGTGIFGAGIEMLSAGDERLDIPVQPRARYPMPRLHGVRVPAPAVAAPQPKTALVLRREVGPRSRLWRLWRALFGWLPW